MNVTMRLSRMIAIAVALAPLCAPADMPKGLFHGHMVSWEGSPAKGVLLARSAAGIVEGCGYDALSILQLSRQRVTVAKLEPGDPLEIITDHKPGSRDCYIRMLDVVPPAPPPSRVKPVAAARPTFDLPHGDRTISGVIIRRDARSITLRTHDGEQTLLLRKDTRYRGRWRPAGCFRGAGEYARVCSRRPQPVWRHRSLSGDVGRDRRRAVGLHAQKPHQLFAQRRQLSSTSARSPERYRRPRSCRPLPATPLDPAPPPPSWRGRRRVQHHQILRDAHVLQKLAQHRSRSGPAGAADSMGRA